VKARRIRGAAKQLKGSDVYNEQDKKLGSVDDILLGHPPIELTGFAWCEMTAAQRRPPFVPQAASTARR
jgi:hypothetical protein